MKKWFVMMMAGAALSAQAEYLWQVTDYSVCGGDYKYAGCTAASLTVEAGVWPVAWGHSVFAVYTTDGWQSYEVSQASWLANVDNPYGGLDERWSLRIPLGYTSMGGSLRSVEYALFLVTDWGETVWDSNGGANYHFDSTRGIEVW